MNVSKLSYNKLFIYQEKEVCDGYGIMAQPYIILIASMFIQYLVEIILASLDIKYKSWFWKNKLSGKPIKYCNFFKLCCKRNKQAYNSNILNHNDLIYYGKNKEPRFERNFNVKNLNVLIDLKNCEHIKKMSETYAKAVFDNCIISNSIFNPKFSSVDNESKQKLSCKNLFNFSCTVNFFSISYLIYQTLTIFYQVINILIKFKYSGDMWINFNNILFLIFNGSGYRTFIGLVCTNVAFPYIDSYLNYLRMDSILSNSHTFLDFYFINKPLEEKKYFKTFNELENYLTLNKPNATFHKDELKKYEKCFVIGRDRLYLGSSLTDNTLIRDIDHIDKLINQCPYFTKKNMIIEKIKHFDLINGIPLEKKILIGSMFLLFLPFMLSGILVFSIPIFFIYVWIFLLFIFLYIIILSITFKINKNLDETKIFQTFYFSTNF